jgi:SRSO17 transposase
VPQEIDFKTKRWIALGQIRWACQAGLPGDMVLLDAGYGHDSKLRTGITELGKLYVAGIQPQMLGLEAGQAARPRSEEGGPRARKSRPNTGSRR